MKSGFVSIVGRPNVGKSTLLNSIINQKIAITSNTAQTTRNIIQGIYNDDNSQIVFVDTPGIHKPHNKLGKILNEQAYYSMDGVDLVLFLIDVTQEFGKGDEFVLNKLKESNIPVLLVINKIDKVKYDTILPKIKQLNDVFDFKEIIPISAMKKTNIDDLIQTIKNYLTDDIKYYDENTITNHGEKFSVSEIIREKVLNLTHEEVPHSVSCMVDLIEEDKRSVSINAFIIVDRESLKKILIGAKGTMIKNIGILARKDIENLLGKKVYLDLKVKVVKNWRDKSSFLAQELGFSDFIE